MPRRVLNAETAHGGIAVAARMPNVPLLFLDRATAPAPKVPATSTLARHPGTRPRGDFHVGCLPRALPKLRLIVKANSASANALGMIISKMRPGEHTHARPLREVQRCPVPSAPAPGFNPHPSHSQTLASIALGLIGRWEKRTSHAMGPAQTHPHRRLRMCGCVACSSSGVSCRRQLSSGPVLSPVLARFFRHPPASRTVERRWPHSSPAESCVPRDTEIPGYLCLLHSDEMSAG